MIKKVNCWEYMKCGREPGGNRAEKHSVCRVAIDNSFNNINSGKNGGRFCWAVAGTFSKDKIDGYFARKRKSCTGCIFYKKVLSEEGTFNIRTKFLRFIFSIDGSLLKRMTKKEIKAGEKIIIQGRVEEVAYIVQSGSFLGIVEKDGSFLPVNHYGIGDIIGGLAVLTGTPRLTTVEAETDSTLWVLKKDAFDEISEEDPELREFLTELVASRFDLKRPVSQRKIGKFIANEIIGRGGYSIIYKGLHENLNIPVVIKMMRHDLAMDEDFLNNFRNEAHIIAKLNNENIVRVYDIEEMYLTLFVVMEFVEGISLKNIIKKQKTIPQDLIIDFLLQILNGLLYAHKNGIIHRDMNPDNVIINNDNNIKILDFGLACPIGTEDFDLSGTLYYMPSEQIDGRPVDERSDIYALSVMAYEMLTGELPFKEADFTKLMDSEVICNVPDPINITDKIHANLHRFILKAGKHEPDERYLNASEAIKDLKNITNNISITYEEEKKDIF
ncbi:MAG: protein kinase, partial [Proteobacteria bacterium]|nr:protein kinase [Pseudomonadota bacterium]